MDFRTYQKDQQHFSSLLICVKTDSKVENYLYQLRAQNSTVHKAKFTIAANLLSTVVNVTDKTLILERVKYFALL